MKKIIDYIIVNVDEVNDYIKKGYQPLGYPLTDKNGLIVQALVKYEDAPTDTPEDDTDYEGLADRIGQ